MFWDVSFFFQKLYRQMKTNQDEEEALEREKEQAVTEEEMADR